MILSNQKGIAHIFIILIILTGITVGVYLVRERIPFWPKAQTDSQEGNITLEYLDNYTKANVVIKEIDWGSNEKKSSTVEQDFETGEEYATGYYVEE